jgi:hypothetical protein
MKSIDTSRIEKRISGDKLIIILLDDINKRLSKQTELLGKIYGELSSEADEGEYLVLNKTATDDVEILYMKKFVGHYVKGYTLENTGVIDIYIGHNVDKSKQYSVVSGGDNVSFSFNRKKIRSIYIKTDSGAGTSTYKLLISW